MVYTCIYIIRLYTNICSYKYIKPKILILLWLIFNAFIRDENSLFGHQPNMARCGLGGT